MKLSEYLTKRNVSAADLAKFLKVSRSTVGRWLPKNGEQPESRPDWRQIDGINTFSGGEVTANDFMAENSGASEKASAVRE